MRIFVVVVLLLGQLWAGVAFAENESRGEIIQDQWAGYALTLPYGWQVMTDRPKLLAMAKDVCAFSYTPEREDSIFANVRGGYLPGAAQGPALVVFWVDYRFMGINGEAVSELAKDSENVLATTANALLASYQQAFPNSMMVNNHLDTDTFILNLRSITDTNNQEASTRHQTIRVIFGKECVIFIASLYTGAHNAGYDEVISKSIREVYISPDKTLAKAKPEFRVGALDYILWAGVIVVVLYLIGRRRLKKQAAKAHHNRY